MKENFVPPDRAGNVSLTCSFLNLVIHTVNGFMTFIFLSCLEIVSNMWLPDLKNSLTFAVGNLQWHNKCVQLPHITAACAFSRLQCRALVWHLLTDVWQHIESSRLRMETTLKTLLVEPNEYLCRWLLTCACCTYGHPYGVSSNAAQLVRHGGSSAQHSAQRADCVTAAKSDLSDRAHCRGKNEGDALLCESHQGFKLHNKPADSVLASHQKAVQLVAAGPEEVLVTVVITVSREMPSLPTRGHPLLVPRARGS